MMNSFELGKFAGIDVKVHWSFFLLPAWILFSTLLSGGSLATASGSVLLILAVFACVVLHEFGHALAARKYGIGTHDIVLYPIGGVASLLRIPKNPLQELVIALAGPAVNVVIAAVLFGLMAVVPLAGFAGWFVFNLALVNVALVVFNMIPCVPDGRWSRTAINFGDVHVSLSSDSDCDGSWESGCVWSGLAWVVWRYANADANRCVRLLRCFG